MKQPKRTPKQQLKALRRKAIRFQNNSSRKLTMAEAMREVQNVSDDV
jgi:hypothetical protein